MGENIIIRNYDVRDTRMLVDIFYNTIHHINIRDYSEKQVQAWAPKESLQLEKWQKKWENLAPIVAVIEDKIVGFAELEQGGHIDCFYVHHEYQGKGVGKTLIKTIFKKAEEQSITRIFAEVSITAKQFFESNGFSIIKKRTSIRKGVKLMNFAMEKFI